jgi:hypothetical protein
MHFFYLDETGSTGANLADAEQPIFVIGGLSVTDEGWRQTTIAFNAALDGFFGGNRSPGTELHACDLIVGQGAFAEFNQQQRSALAHRYLDIIAERGHSIHFAAVDKPRLAANLAEATPAFFDLSAPYLLGFNYLVSYIERYTREVLGRSARAMIILDPMETHQDQIDRITHYRRYEGVDTRRLKRLVEFSYPVDSARHPMIQVSDLVIFLVRKFLEAENGYRPNWQDEARNFFAGCYEKIVDRVRWINIINVPGNEQRSPQDLFNIVRSTHRPRWRQHYAL